MDDRNHGRQDPSPPTERMPSAPPAGDTGGQPLAWSEAGPATDAEPAYDGPPDCAGPQAADPAQGMPTELMAEPAPQWYRQPWILFTSAATAFVVVASVLAVMLWPRDGSDPLPEGTNEPTSIVPPEPPREVPTASVPPEPDPIPPQSPGVTGQYPDSGGTGQYPGSGGTGTVTTPAPTTPAPAGEPEPTAVPEPPDDSGTAGDPDSPADPEVTEDPDSPEPDPQVNPDLPATGEGGPQLGDPNSTPVTDPPPPSGPTMIFQVTPTP
ncbi:hypothetical protein JDV09_11830 [Mycobacterium sp. Y57]|uniref:hypothetical protein n=1 Tax=Mycolicibacterium xanthum TaxID=2796469 RepID=UPI001C842CD3|nr:hypothetical protein [Mycolicibacterium xanthum]MBX7432789.1 hypothetical protein [Mycolicibacterium xanthum]